MSLYRSYCDVRESNSLYYSCLKFLNKLYLGCGYVLCLGLIGAILASCDVVRLILCGPALPDGLKRRRYKSGILLNMRYERDFKLVCSILNVEFFLLLFIAVLTDIPGLMFPWLAMQTCVIVGECILLFIKFAEGHPVVVNGWVLICSIFAIFNWIQVFFEFNNSTDSICGYTHICGYKM